MSHVGSVFFGLHRHKEAVTMLRAILSTAHQEHGDTLHKNGPSLLYFTSACACLQTSLYNSFGLVLCFRLLTFSGCLDVS